MDLFGLDIGFSTVKAVQLKKERKGLSLVSLGEIASPQPGITGEVESQWAEVSGAIKKLVADLRIKTKNVAVNLPEHEVISRLKWFPPMKEGEVKAALEFEAETFIPHPLDKTQIDYEVIDKDEEGRLLVFVVAALKSTVNKYLRVVKLAGLSPAILETPSVSLARIFSSSKSSSLILDLGTKYSNLIAGKEGNVFLTRTIPMGGEAFIRSIAVSLALEQNVAEGYLKAYGFRESELEGKVKEAIMPIFNRLVEEIKKTLYSFQEEWHEDINRIILTGGGAVLPEFAENLVKVLPVEVQVAQPFAGIQISAPLTIDINKEGVRFATAFGLAARGLIQYNEKTNG